MMSQVVEAMKTALEAHEKQHPLTNALLNRFGELGSQAIGWFQRKTYEFNDDASGEILRSLSELRDQNDRNDAILRLAVS